MKSKRTDNSQARANDSEIVLALDCIEDIAGGRALMIGIRNEEGQIYRVALAVGRFQFSAAAAALSSMGLHDELHETYDVKAGCDAIFS